MLENVKMVMQKLNLFFPTLTSFIHHTRSANKNRYRSSKMLKLKNIAILYSTPKDIYLENNVLAVSTKV